MAPAAKSVVVSFDIGKVNMSYCIVELDNTKEGRPVTIIDWNKTNLCEGLGENPSLEVVASHCVSWLKGVFTTNKIRDSKNTWVLVERQRPINPDAFGLAYTVFTFFMSKYNKTNVCFVSAKSKPIQQDGKKRKRASVNVTKSIFDDLEENANNLKWKTWFQLQKKKDDIADSFLQIIGNTSGIAVYEQDTADHTTVIVIDDSDDDICDICDDVKEPSENDWLAEATEGDSQDA